MKGLCVTSELSINYRVTYHEEWPVRAIAKLRIILMFFCIFNLLVRETATEKPTGDFIFLH